MSATESERHELYEIAKHEVNDRFAELMMKSLPEHPDRLATKDDLALLGADLRGEIGELRADLRGEIGELRAELRGEIGEVRGEIGELRADVRGEIGELRAELRGEIGGVRTEMATLRGDVIEMIHREITASTRTIVVSLVSSVTALAIANTLTLALVR